MLKLSWKVIFNSISVLNRKLVHCWIFRSPCCLSDVAVRAGVAWDVFQGQVFLLFYVLAYQPHSYSLHHTEPLCVIGKSVSRTVAAPFKAALMVYTFSATCKRMVKAKAICSLFYRFCTYNGRGFNNGGCAKKLQVIFQMESGFSQGTQSIESFFWAM